MSHEKLIQFDFFKDPEICVLESEIKDIKNSTDKVRKKLFAENNKQAKLIKELSERLEIIERNICKGIFAHDREL